MLKQPDKLYRVLIIGAGPAGTGPIVCAAQQGRLGQLLDSPILIIDRAERMGSGTIGQYAINSDTLGGTFLECLEGQAAAILGHVGESEPAQQIRAGRSGAVPLATVGNYMGLLGAALQQVIDRHPYSQFLPTTEARQVRRMADGTFESDLVVHHTNQSIELTVRSEAVVYAMGGSQNRARALEAEIVPGLNLWPYDQRIMLTNTLLSSVGTAEIQQRLAGVDDPRVVIIGGSHSALSSAWVLLNRLPNVHFREASITILHREKLKIFYPTREAALAEGYSDFTDDDFCPLTKRLYRLGGFRLDSRDLLMRIRGMVPGHEERRVALQKLDPAADDPQAIRQLLDRADLIVPAFGYRPNTIPIHAEDGQPIELLGNQPGALPLVDTECRLLDHAGQPIPGMYAIGLASGFKLSGSLGGEPSFRGQTNGLWLYQNGVGELILNRLIEAVPA